MTDKKRPQKNAPLANIYILRDVGLASKDFMEVTKEEYDELTWSVCVLREALNLEQKYDFVVDNYVELEESLLRCALDHMILGRRMASADVDRALFDRRIMNLLTTVRAYEDSYIRHTNRIFNKNRDVLRLIKELFSAQYDLRLGSWIMPKLRNFVQHQGLPVHSASFESGWSHSEDHIKLLNRFSVNIFLYTSELSREIKRQDWLERLNSLPEKLDLKFLIRDFMEGFSLAHQGIRELCIDQITTAKERISYFEKKFHTERADKTNRFGGTLALYNKAFPKDVTYVGHYGENHRSYLTNKNHILINLKSRYTSSESDYKDSI